MVIYFSPTFSCSDSLPAPTGSGKTVLFELAIIRMLVHNKNDRQSKCIYIAPTKVDFPFILAFFHSSEIRPCVQNDIEIGPQSLIRLVLSVSTEPVLKWRAQCIKMKVANSRATRLSSAATSGVTQRMHLSCQHFDICINTRFRR